MLSASSKSLSLNNDTKDVAISGLELNLSESKEPNQTPKQSDPSALEELFKEVKSFNYIVDSALIVFKSLNADEKLETAIMKLEGAKANMGEKKSLSSEKVSVMVNGSVTITVKNAKLSADQGLIADEVQTTNALSKFDDVVKLCCAVVWNFYRSLFERKDKVPTGDDSNNEPGNFLSKLSMNIGKLAMTENAGESYDITQEKMVALRKFPESLLEETRKELDWKNVLLDKLESVNIGDVSVLFKGFDNFCVNVKGVQIMRKFSNVGIPFFQPPSFIVNDSAELFEKESAGDAKVTESRDGIMSYIEQKIKRKDSDNVAQVKSVSENEHSNKKYNFTGFKITVESISSTVGGDDYGSEGNSSTVCDPFGVDCRVSVFQSDKIRDPKKNVSSLVKEGEIESEEEVPVVAVDLNVVGRLRLNKRAVSIMRNIVESFVGSKVSTTLLYQKDMSKTVYTKTESLEFSLSNALFSLFQAKSRTKPFRLHFDSAVSEVEIYSDDGCNLCVKGAESTIIRPPEVPASISSGIFSRISKRRAVTKFKSISGKYPEDGVFFQGSTEENVPTLFAVDIDPDTNSLNLKMSGLNIVSSNERITFLEFAKSKLLSTDSLLVPGLVSGLEKINIDMCGCKIVNMERIGETSLSLSATPQDDTRVDLLRLKRMTDVVDMQTRFASERRVLEMSNHSLTEENKKLKKQVSELQLENLRLRQGAETKDMLVESMSAEKVVRDEQIQMLKKENEELKNKFLFSGMKKSDIEKLRFLESKNQSLSGAIFENSVKYNKILNENIGLKTSVANLRRENEEILFSTKADSSAAFFDEKARKYEEEIQALREKTRDYAVLSLSFDFLFAKYKALREKFYKQGASSAHKDHAAAFFNFQNSDPTIDVPEKKDFIKSGEVSTEIVPVSEEGEGDGSEEGGEEKAPEKQDDAKKSIGSIFRMKLFNKGESPREAEGQQAPKAEESEFVRKTGLPFYRNMKYAPKASENTDAPKPDSAIDAKEEANTNPFLDDYDNSSKDGGSAEASEDKKSEEETRGASSIFGGFFGSKKSDDKDIGSGEASGNDKDSERKSEEETRGASSIFGGFFGSKKSDEKETNEDASDDKTPKKQKSIFGSIFSNMKTETYDETNPFASSSPPPPPLPPLPPSSVPPKSTQETPGPKAPTTSTPTTPSSSTTSAFFSFKDRFAHVFDNEDKAKDDAKKEKKEKETPAPTPKRMSRKNAILYALMDDDEDDNDSNSNNPDVNRKTSDSVGATEDVPPALPPKPPKKM